jgi:hypothetical protein
MYFWHYGIVDSASSTEWQQIRRFEIYTKSFGNNCYIPRKTGAGLDWFPVEGATRYRVQIAADSVYSSVMFEDSVPTSQCVLPESLARTLRTTAYFWRYRYCVGNNPWSGWIDPPYASPIWEDLERPYPQPVGDGGSVTYARPTPYTEPFIYGLRGDYEPDENFYRYDIQINQEWYERRPFSRQVGPYSGASLVWAFGRDNGLYIYATLGKATNRFSKYNQYDNVWVPQPDLPDDPNGDPTEVSDGGALSYIPNSHIYCMVGGSTTYFWRFTIPDNTSTGDGGMTGAGTGISSLSLAASPNPVAGNVRISYSLPTEAMVSLSILDVQGRLVRPLVDGKQAPGMHELSWNRTDGEGRRVSTGVYILQFSTRRQTLRQKLIVQ